MTDAERLEKITVMHWRSLQTTSTTAAVADVCVGCRAPWPCDTAVALAEVERLRGVVEAARAESAFEAWWNADVPTPAMTEIYLYPTTPFTPRRIYFGPNNRGTAWAAWQAALAGLEEAG